MNARTRLVVVSAAAALTCLTAVSSAHAGATRFDLTGKWVGTVKCKGFFEGAKDPFTLEPTLFISQSGLSIGILADYGPSPNPGDPNYDQFDNYVGFANPDAKKPLEKGEFAMIVCGTDDVLGEEPAKDFPFDEIGRMAVSTKPPKVKASFKGTSIYSDAGFFGQSGISAGTCKYKYTRVDATDPGVPFDCPAP